MESLQNSSSDQLLLLKKIFLSWKDINDSIMDIHKYILSNNFLPQAIVCPYKGGIIPSTILSYHLKINDIHNLRIEENDVIFSKNIVNLKHKNVVLIDNIIDKGENILYMINLLQSLRINSILITSIVAKENELCVLKPHFTPLIIKKTEWAIFPWEELSF